MVVHLLDAPLACGAVVYAVGFRQLASDRRSHTTSMISGALVYEVMQVLQDLYHSAVVAQSLQVQENKCNSPLASWW